MFNDLGIGQLSTPMVLIEGAGKILLPVLSIKIHIVEIFPPSFNARLSLPDKPGDIIAKLSDHEILPGLKCVPGDQRVGVRREIIKCVL